MCYVAIFSFPPRCILCRRY